MLRTTVKSLLILSLLILHGFTSIQAQLIQDLNRQIEIANIININSSETHLYVLSESEGLAVFRAHSDSLQWLYSSTGMQERGHLLKSDIRFAYLFGNNRRITVIEPTSVLGVYSSTILPSRPIAVERIGFRLYTAMNNGYLGYINLESAESVDFEINILENSDRIIDLASDNLNNLYALNVDSEIIIYEMGDDDEIERHSITQTDRRVDRIFLLGDELIGTDHTGNLYLINSDGVTRRITQISGPVERLSLWEDTIIARTTSHELWIGSLSGEFELWKSGEQSGNYFTVSDGNLWVSEFDIVTPVIRQEQMVNSAQNRNLTDEFRLKEINDVILPFPRALILPLEFVSPVDMSQVSISYDAPFNNARIRGNTLYWQPLASQTGRHKVSITASSADGRTATQTFVIDLRSFNTPPQFTPTRPVTIPVDELFDFQITAIDPDGLDQNLIRYLGVDMPNGAQIEEQTGMFKWSPTIRQVGEHRFQVIATDQYGAAASQNFTINVIEITQEEPEEDTF